MGLITGLLTLPLAPVRGIAWVAETVAAEAERELYDQDRIIGQLVDLELALDRGELEQTRFDEAVDALLERLTISHQISVRE